MTHDDLKYAHLTQDELFAEIGRMLMADVAFAAPMSDDEYRQEGANWFMSFRETAKGVVCKPEIIAQVTGPNKDRTTLITILVNVFLAVDLHCPIPLGSLAAALLNYGVSLLCQNATTEKANGN
jgi:hypothetical protein